MKTLLITTAFLTAPMACSVSAQTDSTLKRQIAEQSRQIGALEKEVSSLQSQLNLERTRNGKTAIKPKAKVSTPSSSSKQYIVKSGDTFSGIARKNGISVGSLIAANKGVTPSKIAINQKLVIPQMNAKKAVTTQVKTKPSTTSKVAATKKTSTPSKTSYTVKKGDTFYGIARNNNTTVAKLIALNPKIKPTKLSPGKVLKLSGSSTTVAKSITKKPSTPSKSKTTSTKVAVASKPKPKPVAKAVVKTAPKPLPKVAVKSESKPVRHVEQTHNVAKTVTVTRVMTYGQFASKNNTSTTVLNTLNGLDLPADEPMAVGSALYVPAR